MKEDKNLGKGFIPYMSKAFGFLNTESFLNKNINKLESLSLEEARELLLKEIDYAKGLTTMGQRQHLQKVFNKLFSLQPAFEGKTEKEMKNSEQRLYADLISTPGLLDDKLIRDYVMNYFMPSEKNITKVRCLRKIVKLYESLNEESIKKFNYCYRSSSNFAKSLLYDNDMFDILTDRNLELFNKETFCQLFRFSSDYTIENIFSKYFKVGNDKALFIISQMSNQLYEQLGHTTEFLYSIASLSSCSQVSKILCEYYDRVVGSKENEGAFIENLKKYGMPHEMRELINGALDYSYFYTADNPFVVTNNLNDYLDFVNKRRENNHIMIFGEQGFAKFKDRKFSPDDFKKILTKEELRDFKDAFLMNIYGITSKQADSMVNRYAFDMDSLSKSILDEDKKTFEILKSIVSISSLRLDNQEGIRLLQEAYLKYMEEKGLDYRKKCNSTAVLEGLFNRMYMNTYNSILLKDLRQKKIIDFDSGVTVFDAGVDFNMMVTSLNGTSKYFQNGVNIASKWNTAFRDIGQGMCASFISNQNLGVISLDGPILGFANIPKDALNTMGVTDIYSSTNYYNLKNTNKRTTPFIVGSKMADETRFGYNEIVVDRFLSTDEDGRIKLQPDYVIFYKTSDNYKMSNLYVQSLKTAKEFGIPIVIVDYYKIKDFERVTLKEMERELLRSEKVDKDLMVSILTRYMNNISGDRTIHGHPKLGGLGVFRNLHFPEEDLGKFLDNVMAKCESVKDEELRREWIDAIDFAYQEEYRKHMVAIGVTAYHCSIGAENDRFNLVTDYNLSQRIRVLHNKYDKKTVKIDKTFREGDITPEVETIVKLSEVLSFNNTYNVEKAMNHEDKKGFIIKPKAKGDISLEEKLIIAYFTDNYSDDLLQDFKNDKKEIKFGTIRELFFGSLNKVPVVDKIKNTYLEKEINEKGIDITKLNTFIGTLENMDENHFINVFKAHIYSVCDQEARSYMYLTDKFMEKKANLRNEMSKLVGLTDSNTDSVGRRK